MSEKRASSAGWIVAGLLALTLIGTLAATVEIWDCPICMPSGSPRPPADCPTEYKAILRKYYAKLIECERCGMRHRVTTINRLFWRPKGEPKP